MFEVKGDRPQWQVVYEALAGMDIGDVIKDADLAALLPDAPEGSVRGAFFRAVKQMEDDRKRTFSRVRLVGYKMAHARENEGLARSKHKSAKRSLRAAHRKAHAADRSLLTTEERKRIDAMELNLAAQRDMIGRLSTRVEKLDASLKDVRREQRTDAAQLADRVDRLADLLQRHGIAEAPAEIEAA